MVPICCLRAAIISSIEAEIIDWEFDFLGPNMIMAFLGGSLKCWFVAGCASWNSIKEELLIKPSLWRGENCAKLLFKMFPQMNARWRWNIGVISANQTHRRTCIFLPDRNGVAPNGPPLLFLFGRIADRNWLCVEWQSALVLKKKKNTFD